MCDTYNKTASRGESGSVSGGASYKLLRGNFSKGKVVQENEALFSQLCSSNQNEYLADEKLRSAVSEASKELSDAFIECIRQTNAGFNAYISSTMEDSFTSHMYNRQKSDRSLDIQRLSFSPKEAEVKCKPDLSMASDEKPFKTTGNEYYSITCTKNPRVRASVHLLVAQAGQAVEGIVDGTDDKFREISERLDLLEAKISYAQRTETGLLTCESKTVKLGGKWETREHWDIAFNPPFKHRPTVTTAINMIEKYSANSAEAWAVDASEVTERGARITFRGAYVDDSLSQCRVQWTAVGR